MWFLPLLLVGAIAAAVASRSKRERQPASQRRMLPPGPGPVAVGYALPAGSAGTFGPAGMPGPIAVLGEMLSIGQVPPPTVVLCAIAEAQSIGRHDLASDIVEAFVEPVMRTRMQSPQSAQSSVMPPMIMQYERGTCAPSRGRGGRRAADACYAPAMAPPYTAPAMAPPYTAVPVPTAPARAEDLTAACPPNPAGNVDEMTAMLNSDPAAFMEMVSRNGGAIPQPKVVTTQQSEPVPMQQPQAASLEPGSPLPGVPDANWKDFVLRLRRESPQFNSARHVGQYRQRRERLAELAIDPGSLVNSPEAQRQALDVDLVDAYRHGDAGNLFAQHCGRPISLPGREGDETITLSGVLGVIQVAGLEGAVNWLERPADRKRFPHTTQTFRHTNGVF